MPPRDDCVIIVMSDLHLATGYDSCRGDVDFNEQFLHDEAFARLLDTLRSRFLAENRRWRLLLLGDIFDFPRARMAVLRTQAGRPDPPIDIDAVGLNRIAEGHPRVFEALAATVSSGADLDIVPGNHDIELMHPAIRDELKRLLARFGAEAEKVDHIGFHPWIYYVPGVLYAEHGHQYHDINSFDALLYPRNSLSGAKGLPVGAALDEFVLELRERFDRTRRDLTGSNPTTPTLRQAIRGRPSLALTTLPLQVRFISAVLRHLAFSPGRRSNQRAAYREAVLRPYAAELGLSYETVVAIDELAAGSAMGLRSRLAATLVAEPVRRRWRRAEPEGSARETRRARYLHRAALAVHDILRAGGKNVPYVIFGHAHLAESRPLVGPEPVPAYLNPGSWTVSNPASSGLPAGSVASTFVEIDVTSDRELPTARVMRWDDHNGVVEPWVPGSDMIVSGCDDLSRSPGTVRGVTPATGACRR